VITPLAYIRGRSLSNIFFIVDEAQNLTPHEVKTIITRAGEGTKILFTGDIHQIDTPYLDSQSNGLSYLIDRIKDHPLYAHVTLEKGERSELANLANELL
jgi:PhoH-like ATPase